MNCPQCNNFIFDENVNFCSYCGKQINSDSDGFSVKKRSSAERKNLTVLFTDLSDYTTITENLDPEEVQEITASIFKDINCIVEKYNGYIEKYIGDAVLALFGYPKAHEDDTIRAIYAAFEIHDSVKTNNRQYEEKHDISLRMHTGINSGLVITRDIKQEESIKELVGDTINVASRLAGVAESDEIIVGRDTYYGAHGHFKFEKVDNIPIKGKSLPQTIYKVKSKLILPETIHRKIGLRTRMVGRKNELSTLIEAFETVKTGKKFVYAVTGEAGTGKSRLFEEFKKSINQKQAFCWEGHSFAFTQGIPYYPFINLLNQIFNIKETDKIDVVDKKIIASINKLTQNNKEIIPLIRRLFSIQNKEIDEIDPELWKQRLFNSIKKLIESLVSTGPTILCFEDLHWADKSSIDLIHYLINDFDQPILIICIYRPVFSLFNKDETTKQIDFFKQVNLSDLTNEESNILIKSLLHEEIVSNELMSFITEKGEGNPFYIEEIVNTLVDSEIIHHIPEIGWTFSKKLEDFIIPTTINGMISARLDRLERKPKIILQEAAIIGRIFIKKILSLISEYRQRVELSLNDFEELNFIRVGRMVPDLEYLFRHAITHDTVYQSILIKDRKIIHQRVGEVMEKLFQSRISEFYETLAYHYKNSKDDEKAIYYLIKSGEKSWNRYALNESNQHFKEAFDILDKKQKRTERENGYLIDLLNKWAIVFNHLGNYKKLGELLVKHQDVAKRLSDKKKVAIYYGWLGYTLQSREKLEPSYKYLQKGLNLANEINDREATAYICAWLTRTCADMGRLEEAVRYGRKAERLLHYFEGDQKLFRFIYSALGLNYYFRGDIPELQSIASILIEYGKSNSDRRSLSLGYNNLGCSFMVSGNFTSAEDSFKKAIEAAVDPLFEYYAILMLGVSYASSGNLQEAQLYFRKVITYNEQSGFDMIGTTAIGMMSIVHLANGRLAEGMRVARHVLECYKSNGSAYRRALQELMIGSIFLKLLKGSGKKSVGFILKNIVFIIKNKPKARTQAENHFRNSIEIANEIQAKGVLGKAYMELGELYEFSSKYQQACNYYKQAMDWFVKSRAEAYQSMLQVKTDKLRLKMAGTK